MSCKTFMIYIVFPVKTCYYLLFPSVFVHVHLSVKFVLLHMRDFSSEGACVCVRVSRARAKACPVRSKIFEPHSTRSVISFPVLN